MAYHFVIGALVGAASVLLLSNRRTKELMNRGQHLVRENVDGGVQVVRATTECIREKMQERREEAVEDAGSEKASDALVDEDSPEKEAPSKTARRRKSTDG
ncbi:YtxH domain-containing protein [Desulfurispira natronophila]|uniref:Gas vesicle protein n=1 Tax=Desulfurispira natronophila TaxID=682562 RepID=A0A7W7Y3T8_9BACT|nr:YtxH domain-containing protein [Desulfurispira natronophila]MBB5021518.1 gas vesicle protein [Desulfurispira natronophila]